MRFNRAVSSALLISTVVVGSSAMLTTLGGCTAAGYKSRSVQKIKGYGLVAEYDSNRDRLIRFAQPGIKSNKLYVHDLEQTPSPTSYTFFGGMYTWVAPQNGWVNERGEQQDWPPDPAMDVGPMLVTSVGLREFSAKGPVMRSGLQETKTFRLNPDATASLTNGLTNRADEARQGGIWVTTAAIPGSVIAVLSPPADAAKEDQIRLANHPGAEDTWDSVTRKKGLWTLIRTKAYYWWFGMGSEFKAFVPSDRVIAIHRRGDWLVRVGDPWSVEAKDQHLLDSDEAPVEVYVNFGLKMFEAELLNPIREIQPGETIEAHEDWLLVPCLTPNLRDLDRALNKLDPMRFPIPVYDESAADEGKDIEDWLNSQAPGGSHESQNEGAGGEENGAGGSEGVPMMRIEPMPPPKSDQKGSDVKGANDRKDALPPPPPIDVDEPGRKPVLSQPGSERASAAPIQSTDGSAG